MNKFLLTFCILIVVVISCGGVSNKDNKSNSTSSEATATEPSQSENKKIRIIITSPAKVKQGETIAISCKLGTKVDSVQLYIKNELVNAEFVNNEWLVPLASDAKVGTVSFKVVAYKENIISSRMDRFIVEPNNIPRGYSAESVKSFPHGTNTYTQGLEFYKGKLYESSGEYGKSFIQILEFPSMNLIKRKSLAAELFAEGITIMNDELFLLTWQEKRCLVLCPETLEIKRELSYNTEGWGLTNDGEKLYMTDGSHYVYVLNPADFKQVERLEVMIGSKKVTGLNELEWIDGEIWANIFTSNDVVRINPTTGAVIGIIDAGSIMDKKDFTATTDVLNGIARDPETKKIYMTGKNWPKLFEVSVSE